MHTIPERLEQYTGFVLARHMAYQRRLMGEPAPWSEDRVIAGKRFTNVFRVLDRGTQHLLRELIEDPAATRGDVLMRCFLYRHTNTPQPWEGFYSEYGRYPRLEDLLSGAVDRCWKGMRSAGEPVIGRAYLITVGPSRPGVRTLDFVLDKARSFCREELHSDEEFYAGGWRARLNVLKRYPHLSDFMAQQILTDFHYSQYGGDHENEDVVGGPGSSRGAKLLGSGKVKDRVSYLQHMWSAHPEAPALTLPDGTRRGLSYMDIQNTLCEFDKYIRHTSKTLDPAPYEGRYSVNDHPVVLPAHWQKGTRTP